LDKAADFVARGKRLVQDHPYATGGLIVGGVALGIWFAPIVLGGGGAAAVAVGATGGEATVAATAVSASAVSQTAAAAAAATMVLSVSGDSAGEIRSDGGNNKDNGPKKPAKSSTTGNMQKQVERNQAPKSIERVDNARTPYEKDQVHFKDGSAMNKDGSWKHGGRALTNAEKEWLTKNGWELPK